MMTIELLNTDMKVFIISWINNGINGLSTLLALNELDAITEFRFRNPTATILDIIE